MFRASNSSSSSSSSKKGDAQTDAEYVFVDFAEPSPDTDLHPSQVAEINYQAIIGKAAIEECALAKAAMGGDESKGDKYTAPTVTSSVEMTLSHLFASGNDDDGGDDDDNNKDDDEYNDDDHDDETLPPLGIARPEDIVKAKELISKYEDLKAKNANDEYDEKTVVSNHSSPVPSPDADLGAFFELEMLVKILERVVTKVEQRQVEEKKGDRDTEGGLCQLSIVDGELVKLFTRVDLDEGMDGEPVVDELSGRPLSEVGVKNGEDVGRGEKEDTQRKSTRELQKSIHQLSLTSTKLAGDVGSIKQMIEDNKLVIEKNNQMIERNNQMIEKNNQDFLAIRNEIQRMKISDSLHLNDVNLPCTSASAGPSPCSLASFLTSATAAIPSHMPKKIEVSQCGSACCNGVYNLVKLDKNGAPIYCLASSGDGCKYYIMRYCVTVPPSNRLVNRWYITQPDDEKPNTVYDVDYYDCVRSDDKGFPTTNISWRPSDLILRGKSPFPVLKVLAFTKP